MNRNYIDNSKKTDSEFLRKKPCLHSRKLFNLIDAEENSDHLEYLEKHLYECSECQKYYSKLLQMKEEMEKNIPMHTVDKRIQESFAIEVKDILSNLKIKINYTEKKPEKLISKIMSRISS